MISCEGGLLRFLREERTSPPCHTSDQHRMQTVLKEREKWKNVASTCCNARPSRCIGTMGAWPPSRCPLGMKYSFLFAFCVKCSSRNSISGKGEQPCSGAGLKLPQLSGAPEAQEIPVGCGSMFSREGGFSRFLREERTSPPCRTPNRQPKQTDLKE